MFKNQVVVFCSLLLAMSSCMVFAEEDMVQQGLEIMTKVANREKGDTLKRKMTIEIIDKSDKVRTRIMEGEKKYYDDHSKAVNIFMHPKNIKGTTLLVYDYNELGKDDDQWIYLPATKRSRRIPASRSSEYFMGTDFTFEDMKEDLQLEKFNYKLLEIEKKGEMNVYVIESIPKTEEIAEDMGYSRLIDWIEEESYMANKTEYYDEKGELLKELLGTITQVEGIYTYSKLVMENKQSKHKTIFTFDSIDYNEDISDKRFSKSNLGSGN